ncbi:MAG: translation elongation factor Ts [Bacteroidetes bacterium]|jgi:elongation factor Ts|nr:translation elongation factor Ts [Bacteroidota bacterium]
MAITAADVNKLRQQTGAGMMDCKKALVEAEGDFSLAIDILRKKGQKVAANREGRDASEGLVLALTSPDEKRGVIVVVNCETDFVAKNDDFNAFASKIASIALDNLPADVEALRQLKYDTELTVAEKIIEQTGVIGEKIEVSSYEMIAADTVYAYNHPGNKVASVVGLNGNGKAEVAKDVAMQVAAMAPVAVDEARVPKDMVAKELEIGKELAIQEGKPAEMAEKIAEGRLKKFFQEATLLNQQFIKNNKQTIAQFLDSTEKGLTVTDFKRFSLS